MKTDASHGEAGTCHDDYFAGINHLLKDEGPGHPVMVVDLDLLDKNIAAVISHLPDDCAYRVVAKSLPSIPLIHHVFNRAQTNKAMVFHRPYLNLIARELPETDVLLGKPFPVRSARRFYEELGKSNGFDPSRQLQWLIDSRERLIQYQTLAREIGVRMRINVEIDIGFHRGGLTAPEMLTPLLDTIAADPDHLVFSGFMGYDPHVAHAGKLKMSVSKAHERTVAVYLDFVHVLKEKYPKQFRDDLTFNGAGSPTYQLHEKSPILNDICVGSGLVKPSGFDLSTLADHIPAMFIATPVLKKLSGVTLPFMEFLKPVFPKLNKSRGTTIFITA